jgi:hypothetical protein
MINNLDKEIEVRASQCGSYIDAIIEFCYEKHIQDYETIIELLNPILIEKIKVEFYEKNFIPEKKIKNSLADFF